MKSQHVVPGSYRNESILADSPEIMETYYHERVASLYGELAGLSLLNHPKEIVHICKEIMMARKILRSISLKKRFC